MRSAYTALRGHRQHRAQVTTPRTKDALPSQSRYAYPKFTAGKQPLATYRRAHIPGGTYFFTVVTYGRQPLLADHLNINALGRAFRRVKEERPFTMDAFVLMPDHLHCIWTLPEGNADYSSRWRDIKKYASQEFLFPPVANMLGSAVFGNT